MIGKALRRAATSTKLLIVAALLFCVGLVGGTFANFTAEDDTTTATVAAGWVDPPTTPTLTAVGYDGVLGWTHGANGVLTQTLLAADRGTTSNCTGASYSTTVNTTVTGTTGSYTDSNRGNGTLGVNGDYYCYSLQSVNDSWTSATTTVGATRLGLNITSAAIAAHGTANRIDSGDIITLTFNQNVTYGGTTKVCAVSTGTLYIGDSAGTCGTGDSAALATITGRTIAATHTFATSGIAGSGTSTLTITLNVTGSGSNATTGTTGTWKVVPGGSTAVKSSATPDQATLCNNANTNCQPTPSGTF